MSFVDFLQCGGELEESFDSLFELQMTRIRQAHNPMPRTMNASRECIRSKTRRSRTHARPHVDTILSTLSPSSSPSPAPSSTGNYAPNPDDHFEYM